MATQLEVGMLLLDDGERPRIWTVTDVGRGRANMVRFTERMTDSGQLRDAAVPPGWKVLRNDVMARLAAENIAIHNVELESADNGTEDTDGDH